MMKMKKLWYRFIGKRPTDMPMVKYWKTSNSVEAKVTYDKDGALIMKMAGEDQPFPGFPRGYLLFGKLSVLKHQIKNLVFNDSWAKLEAGTSETEVARYIKEEALPKIFEIAEQTKYDMVPYKHMFLPVKEIYRAWTKVVPSEKSLKLRDILTFIIQEDDGYRFRVQWLVNYFNPNRWYMRLLGKDPIKQFERALSWLEKAEVIGDMKDKQKLLKRILLAFVKNNQRVFLDFVKEVDWEKVKLREMDKYHLRGKYFRCDLDLFDY